VIGKSRLPDFPDVPTAIEVIQDDDGIKAFSDIIETHRAVFAPAGVDAKVVEELRAGLDCALKDPDVVSKSSASGHPLQPLSGAEMEKLVTSVYGPGANVLRDFLKQTLTEIE